MHMNKVKKENQTFEDIKHIDKNEIEFWYARELQTVLEYTQWRRFENVINKSKLSCKNAGISEIEHFADVGKTIKMPKGAKRVAREDILDNMGSDELIANLFRISQTEQKLRKDNIQTENDANKTHYNIGKNIREVIEKNGGTMPEDLPTPKKSLKQLEREKNKQLKIEY